MWKSIPFESVINTLNTLDSAELLLWNMTMDNSLLETRSYINGQWTASADTYPVFNPATGDVLAQAAAAGAEEALGAVQAAHTAFLQWREETAGVRAAALLRWKDLMLRHKNELAGLLTSEQGKPLPEAQGEVVYAAGFLEWFAEEGKRTYGDIIPSHLPNTQVLVCKEPVGPAGAITPWNFPLAMITRKAGAALAAGCSVVVKPSELTPLCAFALALLAEQAGLPPGVFNVVSGDAPAIGTALMESPIIRKISFTGSTRTGSLLMAKAAEGIKKISLELGGNAPFIVFDDADIDQAVNAAAASKFRNTGQTCVCVNRFYIHHSVHDEFVEKLRSRIESLVVGSGLDEGVTQGPLINQAALEKVQNHVKDALEKGGRLITGGKVHKLGGTFYEPTLITQVNEEIIGAREETFGPIAFCFSFGSEQEVIKRANDTPYGLAAYFCTRDMDRIRRVSKALEAGIIGVNEGLISTPSAPFGGIKQSGLGREGSKYGIDEYMELKYILIR